jgi:hypothetical protein
MKVYYHIHKHLLLNAILSQMNPVHSLTSHFIVVPQYVARSPKNFVIPCLFVEQLSHFGSDSDRSGNLFVPSDMPVENSVSRFDSFHLLKDQVA